MRVNVKAIFEEIFKICEEMNEMNRFEGKLIGFQLICQPLDIIVRYQTSYTYQSCPFASKFTYCECPAIGQLVIKVHNVLTLMHPFIPT